MVEELNGLTEVAPENPLLEEWEVQALIAAFIEGRGEAGTTEAEIQAVVRRAVELLVAAESIELALAGEIMLDLAPDGELMVIPCDGSDPRRIL